MQSKVKKGKCPFTYARFRRVLPLYLYLLTFVGALLTGGFSLLQDRLDRSGGVLNETSLTLSAFTPVNAVIDGETMISENEDPQLLYTVPEGSKLNRLTFTVTYDKYPYERCLYYVTDAAAPFDQNKRVWAEENADGSLTFRLPKGVRAIRLDPGSCTDLHATFSDITLNTQQVAADFFIPRGGEWFWFATGPGIGAAALVAATDCILAFKRKKKKSTD